MQQSWKEWSVHCLFLWLHTGHAIDISDKQAHGYRPIFYKETGKDTQTLGLRDRRTLPHGHLGKLKFASQDTLHWWDYNPLWAFFSRGVRGIIWTTIIIIILYDGKVLLYAPLVFSMPPRSFCGLFWRTMRLRDLNKSGCSVTESVEGIFACSDW